MSQVCKITEPLCNITLQQEKNWAPEEVQGDYDYFMAQKAAEPVSYTHLTLPTKLEV